jgi:hypothetical protein
MRTRRALESIDARLAELIAELRRQHELDRREHEQTRTAVWSNTQVTREILLELREHRTILERIDHGVQSNTKGLMHVLDEPRNGRGAGPGTAPAV